MFLSMASQSLVEFTPPSGSLPEGVSDGEEFELVCTFRVKGKKVCITQMGDTKMPGYGSKPDYSDQAKSMQQEYSPGAEGEGGY